jgi:PadR family transcriptional regulator, regulatory protein PadR
MAATVWHSGDDTGRSYAVVRPPALSFEVLTCCTVVVAATASLVCSNQDEPMIPPLFPFPLLTYMSCGIISRNTSVTKGYRVSKPTDLVQGTLDLLILKTIAPEPIHGWAIGRRIAQMSDGVLQVQQGSLYPALHKLERQGWITSHWADSENNRRAKFYALTRDGREYLLREEASWSRLSEAIGLLLKRA